MLQNLTESTVATIVDDVKKFHDAGYRLVTMTAVDLDEEQADILYHFDKDLDLHNVRLTVKKADKIPSISPVYFAALLVENEIQGLFGLCFDGLVLDFGQTLYLDAEVRTTPFCKYGVIKK